SAPAARAFSQYSRIFAALPGRSPTMQLICAIAILTTLLIEASLPSGPGTPRTARATYNRPAQSVDRGPLEGRRTFSEDHRHAPRGRSGSVERSRCGKSVPAPRIPARAPRDRLRVRAHRVVAALRHAVAGSGAHGGDAAVRQGSFLRRVRLRLGVGGRLPSLRDRLLPEAPERGALLARNGAAAACARRRDPGAPGSRSSSPRAGYVVAARALPRRERGAGNGSRRDDAEAGGAVPLGESRLRALRAVPVRAGLGKAQEDTPEAPQGLRFRRSPAPPRRRRDSRRALDLLHAVLQQHVPRAPFHAVPQPRVFPPARLLASRARADGAGRARRQAGRKRAEHLLGRGALWALLGLGRPRSHAALRGVLLPGARVLHRARHPGLRGRSPGRAQA